MWQQALVGIISFSTKLHDQHQDGDFWFLQPVGEWDVKFFFLLEVESRICSVQGLQILL